ncbi:hypothetical protein MRB53_008871 [Persea americana]|uniref:Uncharacterized protein n=1 Tax=Persea americana TaxID=3435 RepID=A0ACC2LNI1_PERAE|nr:hypothetical protein MRB53_008871 [Persea americana]
MWLLYLLFPLIGAQACVPSKSSLPGVGGGHYRIDGYVHSMLLRSAAALELKTGSRAGERDRPSLFPSGVVPTCSPASNRQQLSTCRSHSVRRIGSKMIRIRGPHAPRVPPASHTPYTQKTPPSSPGPPSKSTMNPHRPSGVAHFDEWGLQTTIN